MSSGTLRGNTLSSRIIPDSWVIERRAGRGRERPHGAVRAVQPPVLLQHRPRDRADVRRAPHRRALRQPPRRGDDDRLHGRRRVRHARVRAALRAASAPSPRRQAATSSASSSPPTSSAGSPSAAGIARAGSSCRCFWGTPPSTCPASSGSTSSSASSTSRSTGARRSTTGSGRSSPATWRSSSPPRWRVPAGWSLVEKPAQRLNHCEYVPIGFTLCADATGAPQSHRSIHFPRRKEDVMREKGPILVPLDGSELAEGSLSYAHVLAKALGERSGLC